MSSTGRPCTMGAHGGAPPSPHANLTHAALLSVPLARRDRIQADETKDGLSFVERQVQIWKDPPVKVDNVKAGVCISLHLPFIMTLDVKVS